MTTYIIKDWAGNIMFNGQTFSSFEDAWSFIFETFPEEENFDDYSVEEM